MARLSQGSGRRKLSAHGWDFQVCTHQLGNFYGAINTFLMIVSFEEQLREEELGGERGGGKGLKEAALRFVRLYAQEAPSHCLVNPTGGLAPPPLHWAGQAEAGCLLSGRPPGRGRRSLNYMTRSLRFCAWLWIHAHCVCDITWQSSPDWKCVRLLLS